MKKYFSYILILVALVGIFGLEENVHAQTQPTTTAQCWQANGYPIGLFIIGSEAQCLNGNTGDVKKDRVWSSTAPKTDFSVLGAPAPQQQATPAPATNDTSEFQRQIDQGCPNLFSGSFSGCVLKFIYYFIFQVPSGLLWIAAQFFNVLISLVIQSSVYTANFISAAWAVVRDLSNIFFILILLYVALKTVMNMGGHETKSIITSVIIMAVLINFSLFFTKIVIDSSNILALIFYSKLDTTYKDASGKVVERPYKSATPANEKDISGALYKNFNATELLDGKFLNSLRFSEIQEKNARGEIVDKLVDNGLPLGMTMFMMFMSGIIMLVAAYAFFTSGIFFIGRIVELWLLMIFAPFAFMSFSVPKLSHTEYGWQNWTEKLISTAFMAPIFMFFLYLIFKLLEVNIFQDFLKTEATGGLMVKIFNIMLPAFIIIGMLLKAKDMAKKGGGQFGEMAMGMAKVVMGLAAGATMGVGAAAGQATLGRFGKKLFEDAKLQSWETSDRAGLRGIGQRFMGRSVRTLGKSAATSSFDVRKGAMGGILKLASTATGLNLGAQSKILMKEDGGYEADLKRRNEARLKRAEGLKAAASGELTEELHKLQEQEREIVLKNEGLIHDLDREITGAEGKVKFLKEVANSSQGTPEYEDNRKAWKEAADKVKELKGKRSYIKNGGEILDENGVGTGKYYTTDGKIAASTVENAIKAAEKAQTDRSKADEAKDEAIAAHEAAEAAKIAAETVATRAAAEARFNPSAANTAAAEAANAEVVRKSAEATTALATKDAKIAESVRTVEELNKAVATRDRINAIAVNGTGHSQNEYEDKIIPTAKHHVKEAEDKAAWAYADAVEKQWFPPFRKAELHHSAHEIRMGAKPGKDHGGHGDGHGFVDQLIVESAAHLVTGHDSGGGHGGHGGDDHGGGGHAPAH